MVTEVNYTYRDRNNLLSIYLPQQRIIVHYLYSTFNPNMLEKMNCQWRLLKTVLNKSLPHGKNLKKLPHSSETFCTYW